MFCKELCDEVRRFARDVSVTYRAEEMDSEWVLLSILEMDDFATQRKDSVVNAPRSSQPCLTALWVLGPGASSCVTSASWVLQ